MTGAANPDKAIANQRHRDKHIAGTNNYKQEIANGQYYDDLTGEYLDTANGIIHYDHKGGAHIVPSRP